MSVVRRWSARHLRGAPANRRARADFEPRSWRLEPGAELIAVVRSPLSS
jgi:hypothetical protein